MKKTLSIFVLITMLCFGVSVAHAMPVFDAAKRLAELRRMVEEFRLFNSELIEKGFSEIRSLVDSIRFFAESPDAMIRKLSDQFTGGFWSTLRENPLFEGRTQEIAQIETWVNRAESGTTLPFYLNQVPDPLSPAHRYITFEQAEIARSFDQAEALRQYAVELAEEGREIGEAAAQTNLLGASRLQAASMGKLYEILGVMLAAQGRLAELESISLEQFSRQEKRNELARQKVIQDLGEFVHSEAAPFSEVL